MSSVILALEFEPLAILYAAGVTTVNAPAINARGIERRMEY
jgi:hypothetical protein